MSDRRDYYEILGLPRTASADEIRKAFRKLARQLHPDVNKAPDAAKKFSEAQEAYDVLSDDQKRKAYDRFGHVGVGAASSGPTAASGPGGYTYSWSSGADGPSIEEIFGNQPQGDLGGMFEELFGARSRPSSAGRGRKARARGPSPQPPPVADVEHKIDVPFLTAVTGGKESIEISRGGKRESISVTIPRAVPSGARLRLRNQGSMNPDGSFGDLILTLNVLPHPWYRRDGLDLLIDVPLTFAEAALGCSVAVPTLQGEVKIKIPPATASGRKLRVPGRGIENAKGDKGDFYACIQIVPPMSLSNEQKQALERIDESSPSPRTGPPWT